MNNPNPSLTTRPSRSIFRSTLASLAVCAALGSAVTASAQTTVQVDSTRSWVGYMNVYTLAQAYQWGSGWGTAALTAYFSGSNYVVLTPNTNCWDYTNNYWVNTNTTPASGNMWMEANFYVDVGTSLQKQTVTFTGAVLTNTLASPYTSVAFIKEFAPGYSYVGITTVTLDAGSTFTVTRDIGAGNITQWAAALPGQLAALQAGSRRGASA